MSANKLQALEMANAIQEYQCCGCINGPYPECFVKDDTGIGCSKHYAGTSMARGAGIQKIFLGLPRGFCRLGQQKDMRITIFNNREQQKKQWGYDKFNIPIWKHKNEEGHIIIRGYLPRLNLGFIHIILNDDIDTIDCKEISKEELKEMD